MSALTHLDRLFLPCRASSTAAVSLFSDSEGLLVGVANGAVGTFAVVAPPDEARLLDWLFDRRAARLASGEGAGA